MKGSFSKKKETGRGGGVQEEKERKCRQKGGARGKGKKKKRQLGDRKRALRRAVLW